MSIANYLTFIRIFISPVFMFLYLEHELLGVSAALLPYLLLILFGLSELSDALDGYLARRLHQVTDVGKILDPMADSIYRISVFLTFTQPPINLPLLIVFVFLYRDSVISALRTLCALKGFALAARASGKIKAVVQAICAFLILVMMVLYSLNYLTYFRLHSFSVWLAAFAASYALYSGIEYVWANRVYVMKLLTDKGTE